MSFESKGFFKRTRIKQYECYMAGLSDMMDLIENSGLVVVEKPELLRDKVLNLVMEAADDFTGRY